MRGKLGLAQLDERGSGDGRGDEVGRDRGQAHAEDHAGDHGEHEREQDTGLADADDGVRHVERKTRQAADADDDADAGAGDGHGNGGLGARDERIADILEAHAANGAKLRDKDRDDDRPECAEDDRAATPNEHVEQERDGDEQVAALFHDLTGLGHLLLGQAVEVFLRGAHLHLHEDTHVIEQRGDDGRADDDAVLDAKRFSHDEGGGAHDGRQQLAANGSSGFDRTGEFLGIAGLLHQGDGERARRNDVCDGGAVDGAEEAGGKDRDLRGAALGVSGEGVGNIVEELAHAALVHHFTEDDEQHDVRGRDLDGRAVDAVDIGREVGDDAVPVVAAVHEDTRQIPAEEAVSQKDDGQDAQRGAAQAAGAFEHEQNEDRAHDDVDRLTLEARGDEHRVADKDIDGHDRGEREEDPVVPGHLLAAGLFERGIEQEADYEDKAHMNGVVLDVDHLENMDAGGIGQMVERKGKAEDVDELIEPVSRELAGAGFFFIFLHDLGAFGGVERSGVGSFHCGGFFQISHGRDTPLL